jgi:hypothetical protein
MNSAFLSYAAIVGAAIVVVIFGVLIGAAWLASGDDIET